MFATGMVMIFIAVVAMRLWGDPRLWETNLVDRVSICVLFGGLGLMLWSLLTLAWRWLP